MSSQPPRQRPPPAPSNPVLLAAQAQWLFTDEELTRAPSQLDGMKMEQENISRSKGVSFITQVGIMLKLPQLTLATAALYFHRFFMRYSMVDLPQRPGMHPYPIAATSLFLATKVEENVRRMRELVVACCRVAQKQPNLVVDEQSKEFWKWRDTILHHEDVLLEALCFDLQLEQPYRILYDFLCYFGVNENKNLRNAAWAFVNDSMFTVLCLQFRARTIAAAALYAAARHCDIGFEDDKLGQSWWEQIDVDLTEVRRACTRMAELYENNTANKHSQYYPTTPFLWDEGTEKTRIPHSDGSLGASENASRKRSREPESEPVSAKSQLGEASQNGARSPKRPRVSSDAEKPPRSTAASFTSSTTLPYGGDAAPPSHPPSTSPPAPFSHDRPANGHLYQHQHQHQPHRYQHPLPPTPRTTFPPRRNSESKIVDPIQQRIDQIVQQHSAPPPKPNKRIPGERHREDDAPGRGRKSSLSSISRSEPPAPPPPPPPDHSQPPPPPPPAEPEPDDEGGGSEEGEL
ncbi:putative cyclin [Aspergillus lucknowensis]|uniref:RNA polymerase II holoenzyme cyclin-like subunit n=1 Tax=Aspergillus lucknowensis TaxID=176173 RepID=A0ABR4LUV7_9EURO